MKRAIAPLAVVVLGCASVRKGPGAGPEKPAAPEEPPVEREAERAAEGPGAAPEERPSPPFEAVPPETQPEESAAATKGPPAAGEETAPDEPPAPPPAAVEEEATPARPARLPAAALAHRGDLAAREPGDELAREFRALCASLAEAAGTKMTVVGKDGWLFLRSELRHIGAGRFWGEGAAAVSRVTRADWADPLPAILDFKSQLDAIGVELAIVPVPPKAFVYPEKLTDKVRPGPDGAPPRLDAHHRAFYRILGERGVAVVDLFPVLAPLRLGDDGPAYCQHDTHWSGLACVETARLLAGEIRKKPWYEAVPKSKLSAEWRKVEISGDLWRALGDESIPREKLKLRFVGDASAGAFSPVRPDRSSPVLLLGDSHGLVFHIGGDMHAAGAGLADELAHELGFALDVLCVRGSGATPARINLFRRETGAARRGEEYVAAKKLIVWCFSAREFTESTGWGKVPVSKK
jgi:alginate O-acetyltransferase complex protein AlgJ